MDALTIVMQNYIDILEEDIWIAYIYMRCPDPEMHALTGSCYDCENRCIELKGVQNRVDICRLSQTCKNYRSIVEDYNRRDIIK